jgi:hypothetical protein
LSTDASALLMPGMIDGDPIREHDQQERDVEVDELVLTLRGVPSAANHE